MTSPIGLAGPTTTGEPPPLPPQANGCGEHPAFTAGCRACAANARAYQQARRRALAYGRWRPGLVDAEPIAEMIREMVAAGWAFTILAGRLNRRIMTLHVIAHGQRKQVKAGLAGQVSDLYDEVLCYPPPTGRAATYARNTAARYGWRPPVDEPWRSTLDLDEEVVRRAVRQENPGRPLGVAERDAAIQHAVHVSGRNHVDAARILGINVRTVIRRENRRRGTATLQAADPTLGAGDPPPAE